MTAEIRAVLVDDDPMQVELLVRALAYENVTTEAVTSIGEVGRLLASVAPDFVLLDASALGSDPRASVAQVRSLVGANTRVLLLSAADDTKLRRFAAECETDGWLSKSMPIPDMANRLRELTKSVG